MSFLLRGQQFQLVVRWSDWKLQCALLSANTHPPASRPERHLRDLQAHDRPAASTRVEGAVMPPLSPTVGVDDGCCDASNGASVVTAIACRKSSRARGDAEDARIPVWDYLPITR